MAKIIILVHGLGGTTDETWGNFPNLLEKDPNLDVSVVQYGYQSPHLLKFWSRAPSILNISNGLLTDLKAHCDLENDEILIAGHSLGGLVVKKMLLRIKALKLQHNITKICFIDVPHDGSGYANIGKYLSFRNRHLKSLCRDSSELDDLNDQWVDSGLDNSYDILSVIAANDDIVSSSSSKSIFRNHQVETINDVDHITIVKPENVESSVYIVLKNFILKKNTVNRYKNAASRDLNDWKRIERNHSYHYVSDDKRNSDFESAINAIDKGQSIVRLSGASGLGKTRLLLEAIEKSVSINDECVLVFNAPEYEKSVKESVREAVDDNVHGLIIVENCSIDLHNELVKEIKKTNCELRIVTIGYSSDHVDDSIHIQLSPLSNEAITVLLKPILVDLQDSDVERVARFAQGYPLMATLIAEQYKKEGRLIGSITESSVVKKLIHGDNGVTEAEKEILSACSLFDVFGTEEGEAAKEAKFIAEQVANSTLSVFDKVIYAFSKRQIINRAGRYARMVPKPLALALAADWWKETSYDRQKQLIDNLPESLMQSFCTQATYLDNQPSVQRFSERLFSIHSPFGQAEVLLTKRGSKLFRALVEVNPEATCEALYRVLKDLSHKQIKDIDGNTRRNLVWGLEKLCFHAHIFEEASWCMLLMASAENESWSNNATGMFSQLFRINLSGTGAEPKFRFDVLKRALDLNQLEVDLVVLKALEEAISTYGGSRSIGAEYQGTKAPLQEWKPKVWQEIFDYWQTAFDLILLILKRGDAQKKKAMKLIGRAIRGFVSRGRIQMLDSAIKIIVDENGRYWPTALESIKNTFKYDSEGLKQEVVDTLNSWVRLLSPVDSNLSEKLKIVVLKPPWENCKGDDGHYIDVAAANAKEFAKEIAKNENILYPYLDLLTHGEQRKSYVFGRQLAIEISDSKELLNLTLEQIKTVKSNNISFALGLYSGLHDKSQEIWQEFLDKILLDERLIKFYPDFVCTGAIRKQHLNKLLELIKKDVISANSINTLSYGSVTDSLDAETIADFCLKLSALGHKIAWLGLNIIFMYCHSNKECIGDIRDILKTIVTSVPLYKNQKEIHREIYHWHEMAQSILKTPDQEFAIAIANQLIVTCKKDFNHSDIWSYIKPLLINLMQDYWEALWPIFGDAIVVADGNELYWLEQLLDRENSSSNKQPSVLSALPSNQVIFWCLKNPSKGPNFVSICVNIFETDDNEEQFPTELFVQLLENFGDDERVVSALKSNMISESWSGSLVPYLKADKKALSPLLEHGNPNVRKWVKEQIGNINKQIDYESLRDDEHSFGIY